MAATLSAGGLTVLKTHAGERALPERSFRGAFLERAKEKLGLTEDQVTAIKDTFKADKDTLANLLSKLHEARAGLRSAIQSSAASEASVREASAKVAAVEADLAVERLTLYGKISPVLTDAQREKVKEFQANIDDFVDGAIGRIGEKLAQ